MAAGLRQYAFAGDGRRRLGVCNVMRSYRSAVAAVFAFCLTAGPSGAQTATAQPRPPAVIHHQVSTNAQAQAAFDRGLLDYYAYNPEAAEHEFYAAADLDKNLAMAYWGIALSNAPNLNVPPTDDREQKAQDAIRQAKDLEQYATPEDRELIDAAAARFIDPPQAKIPALLVTYRNALHRIALENPGDPDAQTLYAEAALYAVVAGMKDGFDQMAPAQRAAFTANVAALLPFFQAELAKFPQHVGLLHFYIHAAQMADQSPVALSAARQLASFGLPDDDSHLTHMPGHIYFDLGLYDEALGVGQRSVAMDDADFACCHPGYYSAPRYYRHHNMNFLLYALTETGHLDAAVDQARDSGDHVFLARQLLAVNRWADVLDVPYKKGKSDTLAFSRGIAQAKLDNAAGARQALAEMPDAPPDSPSEAATVSAMRLTLRAAIAEQAGEKAQALQLLEKASADDTKGDTLGRAEIPALFFYSPHMALATLAVALGKPDVARAALQAELGASPKSATATQMLAQLQPAHT